MTTATLRPNATTIAADSLAGGAASAHAATSDDSDATYFVDTSTVILGFGTVTLPAGAVTKQWRLRWRGSANGSLTNVNCRLRTPDAAVVQSLDKSMQTTTAINWVAPYSPVTATQAQIDGLDLRWTADASYRVHEGYIDVVYVEKPVTSVTAVSPDPYTASSEVPIAWSNTLDADGGAQTYYQIRIFDDATYGGGGFDPDTSTPFNDTGVVAGSVTSATTVALPNDTYRAYVRVRQTVNGKRHWSAWAFDQFTVTVPDAEVDTVTMAADNANGLIQVTVARDTGTEAWEFVEVQRSIDAGVTWEYVRGAAYVDSTGNANSFVVDDYEVANAQTAKYRARATRFSSGLKIVGPWVESAGTASWSSDDVWLKDPLDPSRNMVVCLRRSPSSTRQARRGVFSIVGQASPIVVSDVMSSVETDLEVHATTIAETADLVTLATSAAVLLLQTPPTMPDGSRYLSIGSVQRTAYDQSQPKPRQWVALTGAVEVDAPADHEAGV